VLVQHGRRQDSQPTGLASADRPAMHKRKDIQGLRAIAVLAVILDHLAKWPVGGFVGVDIFFVISGYLITSILLRGFEDSRRISLTTFYARRIKRIVPASTLVLVSTVTTSYFLTPGARFRSTAVDSCWALLFSANWRFGIQGTDYFQQGLPPSPVQHYWSLSVEEQFYFVWPTLLLLLITLGRKVFHWSTRSTWLVTFAIVFGITVSSFVYAVDLTNSDPTWAYFAPLSRAWEISVGALVALTAEYLRKLPIDLCGPIAWLGFTGLITSLFIIQPLQGFPAPSALLPVGSTALVIMAGGRSSPRLRLWPVSNFISGYIGNVSYSLYLWHFPIIVLLTSFLPSDSVRYYILATVLITSLSVATFHLIEDPIRHSNWLTGQARNRIGRSGYKVPRFTSTHRKLALISLGSLSTILVALALRSNSTPTYPVRSDDNHPKLQLPARASLEISCLGAAAHNSSCTGLDLGDHLSPSPDHLAEDKGDAFSCWSERDAPMRSCSYGSQASQGLRVALVGDSHAAMLLPALEGQLDKSKWRLDTFLGYDCAWRLPRGCRAMAAIQQRLLSGQRYDVIITTGARQFGQGKDVVERYAAAWRPVASRGSRIVVVADSPGVSASTLECVTRINFSLRRDNCATRIGEAFRYRDPLLDAVKLVSEARVVDMNSLLCDKISCSAIIGNVIVYRDTIGHMTATFAKSLGPNLIQAISKTLAS
jgi:peptidoglycan/LPS O-acetylase OafA/YrhL